MFYSIGEVTAIRKPILESDVEVYWQIYLGEKLQASQSMRDVAMAMLLSSHDFSTLERDYQIANSIGLYQTNKDSIEGFKPVLVSMGS